MNENYYLLSKIDEVEKKTSIKNSMLQIEMEMHAAKCDHFIGNITRNGSTLENNL